jgi:argininosuccinate lyase
MNATPPDRTGAAGGARKPRKTRKKGASALWGGHFEAEPAAVMARINASIDFDRRLFEQDLAGSKAHCRMLVKQGILSRADGRVLLGGLEKIGKDIRAGRFRFDAALEDIHLNIEARLTDAVGEAGKRLHTARSRNDQVATDFKLWVRATLDRLDDLFRDLQAALLDRAGAHAATVMPGFTHMQPAQPVTFGHHLMAYVEMFGRDRGRLRDARARLNECPLGAAALAGTSFPIDRTHTAAALGFDRPTANSIDSVSDRDFALEALAMAAIAAMHLSRLAEELVIWSTPAFGLVRLSEAFTTGSSIMPQKRNPDGAELVRGKSGRVIGALIALLVTMKGLSLAYAKDMQEDKEPVFDALDSLALCLAAMTGMIQDMQADKARMKAAAGAGHATATDLADWLVRRLGLAFRDAHTISGRLVRLAEQRGVGLDGLSLSDMRRIDRRIEKDVFEVLSVERSVASRDSFGGTSPARVRAAVKAARARFL